MTKWKGRWFMELRKILVGIEGLKAKGNLDLDISNALANSICVSPNNAILENNLFLFILSPPYSIFLRHLYNISFLYTCQ